jgi:hypothetical protein
VKLTREDRIEIDRVYNDLRRTGDVADAIYLSGKRAGIESAVYYLADKVEWPGLMNVSPDQYMKNVIESIILSEE